MPKEAKDESPVPAAVSQPALITSLQENTKNVKSQGFLLLHDLDDIAGVRETYLQARTEWLEFLALMQILDSLVDYAAARNGVPWASKPAKRAHPYACAAAVMWVWYPLVLCFSDTFLQRPALVLFR